MKASKQFLLLVIVLLLSSAQIYSQDAVEDLGPTTDGIADPNSQISEENINYQIESNSNFNGGNLQTDEYGFAGDNYYLSGLGATTRYMNVPHNTAYNQTADGSMEAWIYVTSLGSVNYIMTKGSSQATTSFSFFIQSGTEKPALRIGNALAVSNGATTIQLNTWTHVAVTWDDVGTDFEVDFYIDGIQAGTTVTITGNMPVNTDDVRIGASEYTGSGFSGNIDEVRIWSLILTQAQIRANRFIGLGELVGSNNDGTNFSGSESYTSLISSWTFNTGFFTVVFENIFGNNGTLVGGAALTAGVYGNPMPYNNALYFPSTGGNDNIVNIRDTTSFSNFITGDGTIEMWARFGSVPSATTHLISKGATGPTTSFLFGVNSAGKLFFNSGGSVVTSTGPSVVASDWTHLAASWDDLGSNILIMFYMDGELNDSLILNTASITINSDPIRLGVSQAFPGGLSPANFYMDGLRIWNEPMPLDSLEKVMFATSSSIEEVVGSRLLAAWEFDGNMVPRGRFTTMRGTFNTATTNNSRFSSYTNEASVSGSVLSLDLFGYPTTIKRPGSNDSAFPYGSYINPVFDAVPDNDPNGVSDVITVGPSFPDDDVTSVELFLSIEGTRTSDLAVTLTAPNGQSRTVITSNGGNNNNVLTIFYDAATTNLSSTEFLPPWSNSIQPSQAFGNFGNSHARGDWTIKVADQVTGTLHTFLGWGIRLNGATTVGVQQLSTEIPAKYDLSQNYPNPFNPTTNIKFALPKSGFVTLKVYDIVGKEVATLVNEQLTAGTYEHNFNASAFSSGVYFYKISAGDFTEIKKMMLVK
jgi:subtilisin-like proprotein convertase family protein